MYKVVIIDDEPIVLQGIHRMIPWEDMEIRVVGTASDGREGQLLIQNLKPDLVITDICMPEMDGMELIRQTARDNPDVLFIIFSGYSEFQYAKEAISYGVMGYLEKPVDIEELKNTIRRAKEILNRREEKKKQDIQKKNNERRQYLRSLLDTEGKADQAAAYGLSEHLRRPCYVIVCRFSREQKFDLGVQFLDNCVKELQKNKMGEVLVSGCQVILLLQTENLPETAEKIRRRLSACGYLVQMGSTLEGCGLLQIFRLFRKGEFAVKFLSFYEKYGLAIYEKITEHDGKTSFEYRKALEQTVKKKNVDELLCLIKETLNNLKVSGTLPENFRQCCLDTIYDCAEYMAGEKKNIIREEIVQPELPYQKLEECACAQEAEQYTLDLISRMMERYCEADFEEYHYKVGQAAEYIRRHYREDISLVQLADIMEMNPTYFSALFKKSMGITYSQYLIKVRMEKAKELLAEGKKVADAGQQVGYYNSRHFSEGFKKYTGMTPKEYRGRLWENPKNTDGI